MYHRILVITLIFLIFFPCAVGGENSVFLVPDIRTEFRMENNLMSLKDIYSLTQGARVEVVPDEYMDLINYQRREVSFNFESYALGYIYQSEGDYSLLGDSLQFEIDYRLGNYQQYEYILDVTSREQKVEGLFVKNRLDEDLPDRMTGFLQLNLLRGLFLEGKRYQGFIQPEEYKSGGSRLRYNSKLGDVRPGINFRSWGWSVDLSFSKALSKNWEFKFISENIISYMRWIDVYSQLTEDGIGLSYVQNYHTQFAPYYNLKVDADSYSVGLAQWKGNYYPQIFRNFRKKQHHFQIGLYGKNIKLNWAAKTASVGFYVSDLRLGEITNLGGSLSISWSF